MPLWWWWWVWVVEKSSDPFFNAYMKFSVSQPKRLRDAALHFDVWHDQLIGRALIGRVSLAFRALANQQSHDCWLPLRLDDHHDGSDGSDSGGDGQSHVSCGWIHVRVQWVYSLFTLLDREEQDYAEYVNVKNEEFDALYDVCFLYYFFLYFPPSIKGKRSLLSVTHTQRETQISTDILLFKATFFFLSRSFATGRNREMRHLSAKLRVAPASPVPVPVPMPVTMPVVAAAVAASARVEEPYPVACASVEPQILFGQFVVHVIKAEVSI